MEKQQKKAYYINDREEPFELFSSLPYYSILILYGLIYYSIEHCRQPAIGVFIMNTILILSDIIFPEDWLNPTKVQAEKLSNSDNDFFFRIPLYLAVIADWIFFFWIINHLVNQPFNLIYWSLSLFVCGMLISINFIVAHELLHEHDFLGSFIGGLTITKMLYTHFFIEHQYGHHKHVATPHDPATSRLGESLYQFLPRTIVGSYLSAWDIEKKRLLQIEECSTHWHPKNRMIWYTLGYPAFLALIYMNFGFVSMLIALSLALVAIMFLETINYIEHYGLQRKEIAPGEYEKVDIRHSWNAPYRISNYFLFKLQRHSDHHENAYKPYQTLASYDDSPMLPSGYTLCIMMAFFPKIWFKVMNKRVVACRKGVKISEEERIESLRWRNLSYVVNLTLAGLLVLNGLVFGI